MIKYVQVVIYSRMVLMLFNFFTISNFWAAGTSNAYFCSYYTVPYFFVKKFRIVINYQQFASGLNVTFFSFTLSVATFKNYIVWYSFPA